MAKLLDFSKGSGCGCKLPPAALQEVLKTFRQETHKNLLTGNMHNEDAAVWQVSDEQVLISTLDFFTPVVNDAFAFGEIASANAISDVFAMGGKPAFALAIMGWPLSKIPLSEAQQVMQGASKVCAQAGIVLAGGHTIESEEPFFGLAVNGFCLKDHLKTNSGACAGDLIYLTKPLGTGILAAAYRRGLISGPEEQLMMETMTALNHAGAALGALKGVHALTDVTGFGLLGHLSEMAMGSRLTAVLHPDRVPILKGAREHALNFVYPNLTTSNFQSVQSICRGLDGMEFLWLCDPQTNGGLLAAVEPAAEADFLECMSRNGNGASAPVCIGKFTRLEENVFIKLI
jgi:selenide,water dikinase